MDGEFKGTDEWKIAGSLIYSLMSAGFRKGVEQFTNRIWIQVNGVPDVSIQEMSETIEVIHEALNVKDSTGLTPDQLADKADACEKFKLFVHSYLSERGVPHGDPTNQHQIEGCRIGARLDLMFAEKAQLAEQNKQLRRLLAVAYSGATLYTGDGEIQDSASRPHIDYVRMTPEQIEAAFYERGKASFSSKYPPAGDDES